MGCTGSRTNQNSNNVNRQQANAGGNTQNPQNQQPPSQTKPKEVVK